MRIQIKDLYPNPYRDMDNYPINREKVDALKASIKQTGFWDNIVARQKDGKTQIAYGHHRLTALREALPWDTEIDIPIRDLSDATMIQIMANENMQEYSTTPATIDETVKVARKFLIDNPSFDGVSTDTPIGIGRISKFLNWPESRVRFSLERLNLMLSGKIEKSAINKLPTDNAARSFTKAAIKWDLTPAQQTKVVDEVIQSGNFGYDQIEKKVSEVKFTATPKVDTEKHERETNVLKFSNYCADVYNRSVALARDIDQLKDLKEEFTYLQFSSIKDARIKAQLLSELSNLSNRISNLLTIIKNEYNNDSTPNS